MLMSQNRLSVSYTTGGNDTLLKFRPEMIKFDTKEQTEKCLNSLQILKNNLGTEVFSFSNLFFCFLMHSHHHQISILHWAELTQTHAWRSSYVCWLLWAVSTCLSLRRSPVFLRSFMLTYQSHTYSFSAAAEKTRPCRDQNWTCSLSSAAPLL